jgi:DNA processing protein
MTPQTVEAFLGRLNDVQQKHAPGQIYIQGSAELLRRGLRVCIVGTRKPSPQGQRDAAAFASFLVRHKATVVSGLAMGIDTIAHRTAIAAGGHTIAVLGTPLDQVSPQQNAALQLEIGERHLLVSQFAPGSRVFRSNFPQRNRTMALLSDATVIIEAGPTSGTMHQGFEAIRLGRPLFIHSRVLEAGVAWAEKMLDYGAIPVTAPSDLAEALPLQLDPNCAQQTL